MSGEFAGWFRNLQHTKRSFFEDPHDGKRGIPARVTMEAPDTRIDVHMLDIDIRKLA